MKAFTPLLALAAAVPAALAFPAYLNDPAKMAEVGDLFKRYEAAGQLDSLLKRDPQLHFPVVVPGRKLIPDADHPFKAPESGDIRGPCPGLNTMANHGYLSRDGVTSSQELAWAMQESFGIGPDLAEFLGILAVAVDGNPLTDRVTIGGSSPKVTNILGMPTPNGIGRHNAYEIDSSLTRNDKYFGDNFSMNGTLYENMFKLADKLNGGKLNILTQSAYRNQRYFESKKDNPEFSYVPIGVLFYGADHFLWRTLVSTNEGGTNVDCTRESLASTYGAKSIGNGQWEYIPERFPAEWYRSSVPYTIPEIVSHAALSLVYAAAHGAALPTGFDPAKAGDAAYVACYLEKAMLAQVPSALNGIPVVSDLLNKASAGFQQYSC